MKLTCPCCGAVMSLDIAIAHDGAREAIHAALQMPAPLGKLLIEYAALFRPAQRLLTLDRLANLLGELLPMIQAERIRRNGYDYAAPLAAWIAALQDMQDRHARQPFTRPLTSHGYLLEILASKGKAMEAASEQRREEQRRHAPEGKRTGTPVSSKEAIESGLAAMRGAMHKPSTGEPR